MTQWYNTGQQEGVNGHWYYPGDGTAIWQPDTSQQGSYKGQGSGAPMPGHWETRGNTAVWVADNGQGGSGPGAPAPATGAPAPPPDWRTQQAWWGSLYPTDPLQRTAYDLDPNFAWSTMVNHSGVNSWSPEYDWLRGQQGRDYAMYADQNTRANGTPQGNMTFADWIEQNAPTFHQQYQMLPSSQKGYADIFQPGGRVTW